MRRIGFWSSILTMLLVAGCSEDYGLSHDPLPYAPVRIELDLYGEAQRLQEPLSVYYVDRIKYQGERIGHGGVLVVHSHRGQYTAYDAACPREYPSIVSVIPCEDNRVTLGVVCPRCHTVYDLLYDWGAPLDGPSGVPLQQYRASMHDGYLRISN